MGRRGGWCIGCEREGEGPEGSVCVGRGGGGGGKWCVCVCLVKLGQPTLLCLAGLEDANRRFCPVCRSLSHCLPSIQMSRPLQVKPAGTDARSGTTQMRCGKPTSVVY